MLLFIINIRNSHDSVVKTIDWTSRVRLIAETRSSSRRDILRVVYRFCRAMLCISATYVVVRSVRLSVRHVRILYPQFFHRRVAPPF